MKLRIVLCAMTIALCPWLMAPAAVNGSLSAFSGGSQGGQAAADWGIPNPQGGQGGSQGQGPRGSQSSTQSSVQAKGDGDGGSGQSLGQGQSSGQSSTQSSSQGQSSTQNPSTTQTDPNKGEPNLESDGRDPKGEPNDSADGQDPKGEPNLDGNGTGGNGGGGGGSGGNGGGQFPSLDPGDSQYDPANNEDDQQLPSGCAEAGSACAQCVQRHEAAIQFNRRYLHVAWSTTHQTLEMANKALAFGDTVSGIHSTQGLAWQLGGRPQIEEAVRDLRKTYAKKYRVYVDEIENSLRLMSACEQENFAIRDLYGRFGFLYLEFVRSRYESPD
jgi:hypothetical protein